MKDGGSITASGTIYVLEYGELIVDGGTLDGKVIVQSGGTLEVQSGEVKNSITVAAGAELYISGGTVSGTINTAGTFDMSGGSIEVTDLSSGDGAIHVTGGTVNISDGSVTATGTKARAVTFAAVTLTDSNITGGTFSGSEIALLTQSATAGLTVSGGIYISAQGGMATIIDRSGAVVGAYDTQANSITKDSSNYYNSSLGDYTVIVGSTFPYVAKAVTDGTTRFYETLQEAVDAADSADITLIVDTVEDIVIASGKSITLDLAGHTITGSASHTIANYGTLTVEDSVGDGEVQATVSGKAALYNQGNVTLKGGYFTRTANQWYTIVNDGWDWDNNAESKLDPVATMTFEEGVTVETSPDVDNNSSMIHNYGGEMVINGGTFTSDCLACIKNEPQSTLTINGGYITNLAEDASSKQGAIINSGTATVTGGNITSYGNAIYATSSSYKGIVTITGGTFTNTGSATADVIKWQTDTSGDTLSMVTGGTFVNYKVANKTSSHTVDANYYLLFDGEANALTVLGSEPETGTYQAMRNDGYCPVYFTDADDAVESNYEVTANGGTIYLWAALDSTSGKTVSTTGYTFVLMNGTVTVDSSMFTIYTTGMELLTESGTAEYDGSTYNTVHIYQAATVNSAQAWVIATDSDGNSITTYYATLVSAVTAANAMEEESVTVLVTKDHSNTGLPTPTRSMTIDLNGHTCTGSNSNGVIKVATDGITVTVVDSSEDGTGAMVRSSATTKLCTVTAGTLELTAGTYSGKFNGISGDGELVITGGTYNYDPIDYAADGYAVKTNSDTTYTVEKSDVVFNDNEVFMCGHDVVITSQDGTDSDTNLILTYTDSENSEYRIYYTSTTAARIFGGYLTPKVDTTNDTYRITLNSGTVDSLRGGSKGFSSLESISFDSAEITVNGGVVGIIASGWYYNQSANTFTVTVNGGTVTTIYGNGESSYVASQYIQSLIDAMMTIYSSSYTADQLAAMAAAYDFISAVEDEDGDVSYMYVPTVGTANITVKGGTVTYVYGGGKACTQNGSYTTYTSKDFSMVTDVANITIESGDVEYVNGGGFSGPEANWGETSGQDTVIVNTANITVSGGNVTNLFAGGYNGQWKFTYKLNADGELVFSNYNGTNEDEEVRNKVYTANVTIDDGSIDYLYMGGRSYSYVETSNLTVNNGTIGTLSMSGNYGYVANANAGVAGGTIAKLELLTRNYVGNIDLDVTGGTVTDFYAGVGGAYKNGNCNEATYNISTMAIMGDVDVNFAETAQPENAYLTTGLERAGNVSINVQLELIAMNLAASGYTGDETTSGNFKIADSADTSTTWTATIYVDGDDVSFDRNGHNETSLVILPVKLGVSDDDTASVSAFTIINYGESVMYAEVSAANITAYYSTSAYPTTDLTFTASDGGTHTYIFAGWYILGEDGVTCTACDETMWSNLTGTYYAKFVDADILTVQCFYTPNVTGYGNIWRFVTSWDALYANEGFEVYSDENCETLISTITKVTYYSTTYTVGGTQASPKATFSPADFSSDSKYVATAYYADASTELTSCTVRAYWVTSDGTKVYGAASTFSNSGVTDAQVLP
ncbi:MAG: hypothetical protein LUE29_07720 [Lachnospiraceae bacterium]|nr:hypothetical protein [Lachnospiraceae bacterium]